MSGGIFFREWKRGVVGTTEEYVDLHIVDPGAELQICWVAVWNTHATNTLDWRISVISGGVEHPYEDGVSLAAGRVAPIRRPIYLREGEIFRIYATGSGAGTTFQVHFQGWEIKRGS